MDLSASFNDRRFDAQTPAAAGEAATAAVVEALLRGIEALLVGGCHHGRRAGSGRRVTAHVPDAKSSYLRVP